MEQTRPGTAAEPDGNGIGILGAHFKISRMDLGESMQVHGCQRLQLFHDGMSSRQLVVLVLI
jgi:hypothetical protein